MGWQALNNKQKIGEIFDYLITKKIEVSVRISQEKEVFATRILKFRRADPGTSIGKKAELVIDKLIPDRGNSLVQSFPELNLEFMVNVNQVRCAIRYLGISSEYPFFGFTTSLPESVDVLEKRKEERVVYDTPDFISVEFGLSRSSRQGKVYSLSVVDSSLHGIGLLISKKDFELLSLVKPGDRIQDITFFAQSAVIKVGGTVRHITKVDWGRHKGSYILGIESQEIIESSRPNEP